MPVATFLVAPEDAGIRLDAWLATRGAVDSRAEAERLIAAGAVRIGERCRVKSYRVQAGDCVEVDLPPMAGLVPEAMEIPIAWEDEHLLVVDKPAGLVVHPSGGTRTGTLVHGLLELGAEGGDDDRPGIVHRLDRDTSGLLVVARSPEAHARLQDLLRTRELERTYTALVVGHPRSRTGRIEAALGRDRDDRTRMSLDTDTPRHGVTWFSVDEWLARHTLLSVRLETGRTHQIRVHLQAIELPVAGDETYGVPGELGLQRQFLHASQLRFEHPFTGERLELSSPLPADLQAALTRARAA